MYCFVILVYDFGEKRVTKALKTCRRYLNWVQNSVFEGEISEVNLKKLKADLKKIMDEDEDSIIIYTWRTLRYTKREIMGVEKSGIDFIL
ncbi:CRISPR-associated endonuclease Cas2 [Paenibacillus larvae]|uniref:CRISPR-associated endonuclease Cas2 n=1 Tax=Paenibacillus larvae TaxID=1464 RepID=UPI00227F8CF5|nr:CRISPR-associated endonuclease Cas2 [Paenibacillus larvae]MCY9512041.1 CRISPR-associated endonuclease Cas2 [Paenibacillus larvae]MCY9525790.1 CRISPR-associated endonuclease Cas2 [Paenibacillus larvae]